MKFIRKNGRIIPIREHTRSEAVIESAVVGAGASAGIYGTAKLASKINEGANRATKLAKRNLKFTNASALRLQKAIHRNATPVFKKKLIDKVIFQARRTEKLTGIGNRGFLGKTILSRGAFVLGGIGLGHAITKGIKAITGEEADSKSTIIAHGAGLSASAIASRAIQNRMKMSGFSKINKILKMVRI